MANQIAVLTVLLTSQWALFKLGVANILEGEARSSTVCTWIKVLA